MSDASLTLDGSLNSSVVLVHLYGDGDGDGTYENYDTATFDPANVSLPTTKTVSGFAKNTNKYATIEIRGSTTSAAEIAELDVSTTDAPTNLTETTNADSVDLSWTAGFDIDHYDVYRSETNGSTRSDYNHVTQVPSGTTTYPDDGSDRAHSGEGTYYYRVGATYTDSTDSDLTNEASSSMPFERLAASSTTTDLTVTRALTLYRTSTTTANTDLTATSALTQVLSDRTIGNVSVTLDDSRTPISFVTEWIEEDGGPLRDDEIGSIGVLLDGADDSVMAGVEVDTDGDGRPEITVDSQKMAVTAYPHIFEGLDLPVRYRLVIEAKSISVGGLTNLDLAATH